MYKLIPLLTCLFVLSSSARAQDSTVIISTDMFDKTSYQAFITTQEGWVYKAGHDTAWAAPNLNTSDWERKNPSTISVKDINSSGKVEGWFRIKLKITDSIYGPSYGIRMSTWAANDVYVNGELIFSVGNTGANGKPYEEYNPYNKLAHEIDIKSGEEFVIAIHLVDYPSPFSKTKLKSYELNNTVFHMIRIAGKQYNNYMVNTITKGNLFNVIWIIVCLLLSFLFWLLYFQNPKEKNLKLFAWTCLSYFLTMYFNSRIMGFPSYNYTVISRILTNFFISITIVLTFIIVVRIFNRKLTLPIKLYLYLFTFLYNFYIYFEITSSAIIAPTLLLPIILMLGYYIISSWKTLKGPQWAIVVGVSFSLISGMLYRVIDLFFSDLLLNNNVSSLFVSVYCLSFPISLLVYVAMRFKEIIRNLQEHSDKVIQLSEESRLQALNQKSILEKEVSRQTIELRNSLETLKNTQSQLIQSEKMASLGELTAGIAHEIQNPLNFVNNFSDVSNELFDEMNDELNQGNIEEVKQIAQDIKMNLDKINHHGKRADAIVKGMLQHSRKNEGQKEPTDINALCDEYLRLSYHGLRAKDKSFNATFNTSFDESIGKINVLPQDTGRVILNLINNAFYATNERKKLNEPGYVPTVIVSTSRSGNHVEIKVKDNGCGIPKNIVDKIFQPFFTTKPTGQGTGLGLSLSFDIITKGHGGDLRVDSKEGEGTTFTILLKVNN